MSKLLKLKEWLTLGDAAKHFSIMFGEEVTVADILRLALDGRLTLSVNIVNEAYAKVGTIKERSEARHIDVPLDMAAAVKAKAPGEYQGEWTKLCMGLPLVGSTQVIDLEDGIVKLHGVYDLPMIGGERFAVEGRYQQLTGGPEVTSVPMDGAFLSIGNGQLLQLQDHFEGNPYVDPKKLKKPWNHEENFFPGGGLPDDAVLVVRTDALTDFRDDLVEGADEGSAKTGASTRERNTLLKLVIGMAIECYRYSPGAARNEATAEIAGDLAKHDLDVSDDTVRKYLKEAAMTVLSRKPGKT